MAEFGQDIAVGLQQAKFGLGCPFESKQFERLRRFGGRLLQAAGAGEGARPTGQQMRLEIGEVGLPGCDGGELGERVQGLIEPAGPEQAQPERV